jgi:hypothetical protein
VPTTIDRREMLALSAGALIGGAFRLGAAGPCDRGMEDTAEANTRTDCRLTRG